jgi:hypothetical protein
MFRRTSKFLQEIAAQMLVGFCTKYMKGPSLDNPPLPPAPNLQKDKTIPWEIQGSINYK